ncbi:MAG: Vgb family protein [Alphaproteobacteria bacterium]
MKRNSLRFGTAALISIAFLAGTAAAAAQVQYYELPKGEHAHDVAPAPDGTVWYTGQRSGVLGRLHPKTGKVERIHLGKGAAPHGVIIGPDGAAWVTEGGQNAIARVDLKTKSVRLWKLPEERGYVNLNTAAFDRMGRIWFTGQNGIYGRLEPKSGEMKVWDAPKGRGPYGISATRNGDIWFVSLAGSYLANVDLETGKVNVIEPPAPKAGTRRVWADSKGRLWVSEWIAGKLSVYDPAAKTWKSWALPGDGAKCYAVFVDENDKVWVTDFAANAILRFDPVTEKFRSFPSDKPDAQVRQLLGRKGEVWGGEYGTDRLVVIRSDAAID